MAQRQQSGAGAGTVPTEGARQRLRRLIYNNDGNDIFLRQHGTPEGFLAERIIPALSTQVDTIFYCTGVTTLYDHDTEVGERSDDLQDARHFSAPHSLNRRANMHMLRHAGVDSLSLVTQRAHAAGLEVFWSHRINDIHDSFTDWLFSDWKRAHPEYLLGRPEELRRYEITHPRYMWSALDFEKPAVLDYLYRITEEVCQRYDVDGVEIDYLRHPVFFRENLEYRSATAVQAEMLSGFQRRLREMIKREGRRRGRALLLAAHVPLTVERCRHVGIDIGCWLREGLLDLLVTGSGYQPLSLQLDEMVRLGQAHGVPVYPNLSHSGMEQWGDRLEAWRGAAANVWRAGADGIHLFNWFPGAAQDPIFVTLGERRTLAGLDKVFGADHLKERFGCLEQAIEQAHVLPVELDPAGSAREVNLPIGDDLAAAASAGTLERAVLRLQVSAAGIRDAVEVSLNGHLLVPAEDVDARARESMPVPWRELGNAWRFAPDPGDQGVRERWYEPGFADAAWAVVRSDTGNGWESQGFAGYHGVGWYRQRFIVNEDTLKHAAVWMLFGGVDKQGEVYLNGHLVFTHTEKSTGLSEAQLWNRPFVFNVRPSLVPGANTLCVRVQSSMLQAGVYRPVYLLLQEEAPDAGLTFGTILADAVARRRLSFRPDPAWYRTGNNAVTVRTTGSAATDGRPAQLTELELEVRYRRSKQDAP